MLKGSAHDLDALAAHIASQRWFGAKSSRVERAEIVDLIPVRWPTSRKAYAVGRARVTTNAGTGTYQLFLRGKEPLLEDALRDDEFLRGLAAAFQAGAEFAEGETRWIVESVSATPFVVAPKASITLGTAEQTNTSVFIKPEAILKLYRRLEPGVHPDVEVTRFLTVERSFVHVPALLGEIRFEDASGVTIAGMLQEMVPGAVDGWTYALEISRPYFTSAGADHGTPFETAAAQLGTVTRGLHEVLASGSPANNFDIRRATKADVQRWTRAAWSMADRALASLERAVKEERVGGDARESAESILKQRDRYRAWIEGLPGGIGDDAGALTRTHGDYHLGQVLRSSADRFLVIDFEGEPARPLDERRAHQSPLRDVAGMLRSFAYAAAVAGVDAKSRADGRDERWESGARRAFLDAYLRTPANAAALLPNDSVNVQRLIALFEAEKVFYELQYELDHRPDWVWIPTRGIANLET